MFTVRLNYPIPLPHASFDSIVQAVDYGESMNVSFQVFHFEKWIMSWGLDGGVKVDSEYLMSNKL